MIGLFGRDQRLYTLLDTLDHVAQAIRPGPVGIALLKDLPGAHIVAPELIAVRVPVLAHHLDLAFAAVDLDAGTAVLLHREAGRNNGVDRVAEIDQNVGVVFGLDLHHLAVDDALRDRDAGHRHDALRRPD